MPRGFTWQGSGHFQITRIIGRQPFKFKFWTDHELRSEGPSVDLEQRLWIDKKISRIIFKPHSEVGLVSWTSLFKTFFNQGLILEPSSLTIVLHSTVGFIVVTYIGDKNIGDKIYIIPRKFHIFWYQSYGRHSKPEKVIYEKSSKKSILRRLKFRGSSSNRINL